MRLELIGCATRCAMAARLGSLIAYGLAALVVAAPPDGPAGRAAARQDPAVGAQSEPRFRLAADDGGEIAYFIASGESGSGYRAGDSQLAVWAMQEWERRTGGAVRFRPSPDEASARLRVHWLPWAEDAALGRMEPALAAGHDVASIDIRPDEDRFRPSIRRRVLVDPLMRDVVLYYVCLHEIGHALGLSHSANARDIMWPGSNGVTLPVYDRYRHRIATRDDIPRVAWLSQRDIARVTALWDR